ncbi:MAG: hypothetical protein AB7S75_09160 [Desulfococcaceae bacterium]
MLHIHYKNQMVISVHRYSGLFRIPVFAGMAVVYNTDSPLN